MKKLLLLLFCFGSFTSLSAQKLGPIKRYCLLPYIEIGLGQTNTFAKPGYYNTFVKEKPLMAPNVAVGLGKQLDDLKFTTAIGIQFFDFSANIYSRKTYIEGQTASYFNGHRSYDSPQFDTSVWYRSEFDTEFIYSNLILGVEKSYGQHFSFGFLLRNNFLIGYFDDEIQYNFLEVDTGMGPSIVYSFNERSDFLGRSVRGIRRYQAMAEIRGSYRIRRQNLKADVGLNAMLSINSVSSKKPTTTYLRHIGLFTRFYILPKQF